MFTRFDRKHKRDRRTDKRTDTARRHRPRLYIASRRKKDKKLLKPWRPSRRR